MCNSGFHLKIKKKRRTILVILLVVVGDYFKILYNLNEMRAAGASAHVGN